MLGALIKQIQFVELYTFENELDGVYTIYSMLNTESIRMQHRGVMEIARRGNKKDVNEM